MGTRAGERPPPSPLGNVEGFPEPDPPASTPTACQSQRPHLSPTQSLGWPPSAPSLGALSPGGGRLGRQPPVRAGGRPANKSCECFNKWKILEIAEEKPVLGPKRLGWGDHRRSRGRGAQAGRGGCLMAWSHPGPCCVCNGIPRPSGHAPEAPRSPPEPPGTPASAGCWARPAAPHSLGHPSPHCLQAPDGGIWGNLVCAATQLCPPLGATHPGPVTRTPWTLMSLLGPGQPLCPQPIDL